MPSPIHANRFGAPGVGLGEGDGGELGGIGCGGCGGGLKCDTSAAVHASKLGGGLCVGLGEGKGGGGGNGSGGKDG